MKEYERVQRIERVVITYRRGRQVAEGQESRVYRVCTRRYPSGTKYELLVWSAEAHACVWVREDDVRVLAMAQRPIHTIH